MRGTHPAFTSLSKGDKCVTNKWKGAKKLHVDTSVEPPLCPLLRISKEAAHLIQVLGLVIVISTQMVCCMEGLPLLIFFTAQQG